MDTDDVVTNILGAHSAARAQAVSGMEDNPDEAARAVELSKVSGVPPAAILGDLQGFEDSHKRRMASEIIRSNQHLVDYVNADPMHSRVSSDDYGQLDAVSQHVSRIKPKSFTHALIEGWNKGVGEGGIGAWGASKPSDIEYLMEHPGARVAWATLSVAGAPIEVPFRTISGLISAAAAGVGHGYTSLTGDVKSGNQIAEAIELAPMFAGAAGMPPYIAPEMQALAKQAQRTARTLKPYIDAGIDPPAGIDPVLDQVKAKEAEFDANALKDALKEAQGSATRERSPDMFAQFIRQHTDARIGISAEAVRKLYGDKQPVAGDGVLGWVPDIADQLRVAEASGGDISVPLADWLARVDPETAKALHDDVRVRGNGLTLNEAKEVKPIELEGLDEDIFQPTLQMASDLRRSSALEPLAQRLEDKKLQLKLVDQGTGRFANVHDFDFINEAGKPVGEMQITNEGKNLVVEMVSNKGMSNAFGPSIIRDIAKQLKALFPEAETISGFRVSGAREKAGVTTPTAAGDPVVGAPAKMPLPRLAQMTDAELSAFLFEPIRGTEIALGEGGRAFPRPTTEFTESEAKIFKAVDAVLSKIAPRLVEKVAADRIEPIPGRRIIGVYQQYRNRLPLIVWSLESPDAVGTARHEAMHHLKRNGFFTQDEWASIEDAAEKGNWISKHNIGKRYPGADISLKLEEAVAEEFAVWRRKADITHPIAYIFERLQQLLDRIKAAVHEALGRDATYEDLFTKADTGEIGSRRGVKPELEEAYQHPLAQEKQLEMEEMTRLEDREMFAKAAAIGMTVKQYRKYLDLIAKRDLEDIEAAKAANEKDIRRRQTKEWKDAEATLRSEIKPDVSNRPDIAADEFLRTGVLYEEKVKGRPRLDASLLTDEQKAAIPADFYTERGGLHLDDVAGLFGFTSGQALVERLGQLRRAREESKLGPNEYVNSLVNAEVERRMQKEYGDLEANIIDEAKEHVISTTQMDLIHEEVQGLGMRAGEGITITKEAFAKWTRDAFGQMKVEDVSSDKFLKASGRTGTLAERALLEDNPKDAFKLKQQQYMSMLLAREAVKFEKAQKQFEKTAKQFSKREVPSAAQEYTNFIHDILFRLERPPRRSVQDMWENMERDGYATHSLEDFVRGKEENLRELHVPEFLLDPNFRKPVEQLTTEEFSQINAALKAMAFNAKNELKVFKAGEEADLNIVKGEMYEALAGLGDKVYPIDRKPSRAAQWLKNFSWNLITVESMMNRLDRDRWGGVFNQYITRQFADASNHKARLLKEYQGKISEIGKIKDMDRQVDNSIFYDPHTFEIGEDGKLAPGPNSRLMPMRRRNVLGILQNVGNESNLQKLAKGYGVEPAAIMEWLRRNTTKEDWDRAQKIGDLFNEIFDQANVMSHQISGVSIQRLPLEPIQTPFGTYAGWYNPVKYDPLRPGASKNLMGRGIEEEGYYRATTPQGYAKERTGYIAPIELNLDVVPVRMQQMLHDIAMRPAVIQLSKFFYDPKFKSEMIKHFGEHQAEQMIPFLRDIANASDFKSHFEQTGNSALEFFRQNMIATLIGFNPGTVMKHGTTALVNSLSEVGVLNWTREFKNIVADSPTSRENWKLAMEKSEELQRRMRNFSELIHGYGSEINLRGARNKFDSYREFMMSAGATPVSISDLLSAVPTWLAAYKEQIGRGANEGDAVSFADRSVRRAHGSAVLSNKPAVMRSNGLGAWFSSLYGFFSHMMQKQYELGWKAKDVFKELTGKETGDVESAYRHVPDILKGFMSYIIIPAVVEELVTPYTNAEKDSWGVKAAKTIAHGLSSSVIGIRDFANGLINFRDPSAGLISTAMQTAANIGHDVPKMAKGMNKEQAAKAIVHTTTIVGLLTGLTNKQEGNIASYLYRYNNGLEHPKSAGQWFTGLWHGTNKRRK